MRRVSNGVLGGDIAVDELVQAGVSRHAGVDRRHGQEHGPGNQPNREQNLREHTQEAYEEVGVEPIGLLHELVVRAENC